MKIMIKRRGSAYSHRNKVIPYHQGGWRRIHPWGSSLSRRSPYPPCSSRVSGWMRMLRWLRSAPRPRRGVRWRPAVASQSLHPRAELLTARCSSLPPRDTWAWADAERMLNKHPSSLEKTRSFTRTSQTRSWAELSRARSYSICNLKKSTAWSGDSAPPSSSSVRARFLHVRVTPACRMWRKQPCGDLMGHLCSFRARDTKRIFIYPSPGLLTEGENAPFPSATGMASHCANKSMIS